MLSLSLLPVLELALPILAYTDILIAKDLFSRIRGTTCPTLRVYADLIHIERSSVDLNAEMPQQVSRSLKDTSKFRRERLLSL